MSDWTINKPQEIIDVLEMVARMRYTRTYEPARHRAPYIIERDLLKITTEVLEPRKPRHRADVI